MSAAAALALVAATLAPTPVPGGPAAASLQGRVVCQGECALPAGAVVRVRLLVVLDPERPPRRVAEVSIPTAGRPLPFPFELPYDPATIDPKRRYLVRASVVDSDHELFANRSAYPVLTHGAPGRLDVVVEPVGGSRKSRPAASTTPEPGLAGAWKLVALGDVPLASSGPSDDVPTLEFDAARRRLSGSTGCNRFFGTYTPDAPGRVKLDPAGMTRMACPDPVSEREKAFLDALRAADAYRIDGEALELLHDGRFVARFARSAAAPSSD